MIIVITGGSSGIGFACASYLIKKGHTVYSLSRSINEANKKINYLSCDVTNEDRVKECLESIYQKEKRIDVVINNAGFGTSGAVEYESVEMSKRVVDVNLFGTINVNKYAIKYLKESKGHIINISSVAGKIAIPFQASYSYSKAAIINYSEALMLELKPLNIKVNCLLPGDTKTSFTKNRIKSSEINEYTKRIDRSITKMEHDEQNGDDPIKICKKINGLIKKKNSKCVIIIGFKYKLLVFLTKILPSKLVSKILYNMYAK